MLNCELFSKPYKITMLVALYRAGPYIAAKLRDIVRQTVFEDIAVVLLNCQNLDGEADVYQGYVAQHSNVTAIQYSTYRTLYATWNDGIQATVSQYIMNSNVDDMLHPEYVQICCEHLDAHVDVGVTATQALVTDRPCQIWPDWHSISAMPVQYPGSTMGPCPVWRRQLHEQFGYFQNYRSIGDARMWERWHAAGVQFSALPQHHILYYLSPTSLERRLDPHTHTLLADLDRLGEHV